MTCILSNSLDIAGGLPLAGGVGGSSSSSSSSSTGGGGCRVRGPTKTLCLDTVLLTAPLRPLRLIEHCFFGFSPLGSASAPDPPKNFLFLVLFLKTRLDLLFLFLFKNLFDFLLFLLVFLNLNPRTERPIFIFII